MLGPSPQPFAPAPRTLLLCSPVGYWCTGGTNTGAEKTACSAGTANPLLGLKTGPVSGTACTACVGTVYTSYAAAAYCDVPTSLSGSNLNCVAGKEWDASSQTCIFCSAGWIRASGSDANGCTAW